MVITAFPKEHNVVGMGDYSPCPNKFKLGDYLKYIKRRIDSPQGNDVLLKDLTEVNIVDFLDPNNYRDPNENYNILHEILTKLKDKHM